MSNGIRCPECGRDSTVVRDSRPIVNAIRRRRFCDGCGCRFTTHEILDGDDAATEVNKRIAMMARRLDRLPQHQRLTVLHVLAAFEAAGPNVLSMGTLADIDFTTPPTAESEAPPCHP